MTTDTIARLGQLLLRRGDWNGRRVLSEEWIDAATSRQVGTPGDPDSDWAHGYGFQHWIARHGFRGDGAIGQFCLVLPDQDAVVAIQAQSPDMQETLDAAWRHLLPAFDAAGSAAADAELADRLARVSLSPLRVDGVEPDAAEWDGATFGPVAEGWLSARVERSVGGWRVVLTGSTGDVEAAVATGADAAPWYVSEGPPAVAVSGGFTSGRRLALDIVFLETPHRLHVVLERSEAGGQGLATATWRAEPLREPHDLLALSAPRPFG